MPRINTFMTTFKGQTKPAIHPPVMTWKRCRTALALAGTFGLFASGYPAWASPLPERHLFLDPAFIEQTEQVSLQTNPPTQSQIVIRPDRPWEKLMISFFLTVLDEGSRLRLWYICRDADNQPNVAYAESTDGVTWIKPNLGLVDYHGSKDNNLVGIPYLEGVVFRDPKARPGEEYVYVTSIEKEGIIVRYHSPDGLRWQRDAKPLLPFRADTQNVTLWDENLKQYVLFLRGWDVSDWSDWKTRLRKVVRLPLADLTRPAAIKSSGKGINPHRPGHPWFNDEAPTVFAADAHDPPQVDVYNLSAQLYPLDPRWYLGFPSLFQREKGVSDGRLEVQFTGSRDGITWHRYDRRAYVRPGMIGTESANMAFMGTGMVVRGDEIWHYGTGFQSRHGDMAARQKKTDGTVYRHVQRVDGFVSLNFDNKGRCITAPVTVNASRLLVNLDTGALGNLRVGLLDEKGNPVPGFTLEDSDVMRGNATGATASWRSEGDLSALRGRRVRLSLSGSRAKLYSFRFEAARP